MAGGRPTKYHEYVPLLAKALARRGATDEEIAKELGISVGTLYRWEQQYPELRQALKEGKAPVDAQVEDSLLKRALGYEYEEVERTFSRNTEDGPVLRLKKVKKHVVPDVTAQIFWLKNRRPDLWRDRHDLDVNAKVTNREERHLHVQVEHIIKDPATRHQLRDLFREAVARAQREATG